MDKQIQFQVRVKSCRFGQSSCFVTFTYPLDYEEGFLSAVNNVEQTIYMDKKIAYNRDVGILELKLQLPNSPKRDSPKGIFKVVLVQVLKEVRSAGFSVEKEG